ncbi:putative pentatricopeptide repeat-containing protein [Cucumis melo var. makuwa]|uniref:Pentatricopeptide repeat-containing protein n=2 Tax=Cucumis melo TaxID=3656 RepID=A0A5A7SLV1_CUCMM|nr:putative pentatricopeptide repeat-containing protein [Cucumis melo var. makuwa]TYK07435.1 putative pentatricopeptide repeat-containing protein [Cucumis melo var. makuwa]
MQKLANAGMPPYLCCFSRFFTTTSFAKTTKPKSIVSLYSISALLKLCKTHIDLQQVHVRLIQKGLEQDTFLVTQFISASNSVAHISYSTSVFDRVLSPSTILWNSLVSGYCAKLQFVDIISLYVRMKREDGAPDRYTFPSLLKVCASEGKMMEGMALHGSILRCGVDEDIYVTTSLVNLYGKGGLIGCARKVFDRMSEKNVVSWTAMIVGYSSVGNLVEAKRLFDLMPERNVASWNAIIGGYMKMGDVKSAEKVFDEMPEKNVVSFTTMIDGYAKAGDMLSARNLFQKAPERDIIAWSALISGYTQNGQPNEAVQTFLEMSSRNVKPDKFVLTSLMLACSQLGNLDLAKWVDSYATGCLVDLRGAHVRAALIDMNAKCGNMERAMYLFEEMPKRDLISYCSVMQGLSIHGHGDQAVSLFERMLDEDLTPDDVAFTVILTACSRAGLVDEGWHYFEMMRNKYSMVPSLDHYACIVDLLSRSGRLKEAYELIKSLPVQSHAGAWGALLGACKLYCDSELAEVVASRLIELEPENAGNYVLLSNIYAAADRWLDVSAVRDQMNERGLRKIPGCSWI